MKVVQKQIDLTDVERDVFDILKATKEYYNLGVTLRCAGGWVRDKMLGQNSDDIDVALDTMLGAEFAEKVNGYLEIQGEEVHDVAVIETNPEQSKHLETARVKIHGLQIDLVNLRSESYTSHSRVPTMDFGTPSQDAYRRDLTINSLFYNIDEALIEDFTEMGLEDLKCGLIRTPLPPLETFLDDPLRVLRSIRFASRFGFEIDKELLRAATNEKVIEALKIKISRERIGTEMEGIFKGPDPVTAVGYLVQLSLFSTIFLLPEGADPPNYGANCLESLKAGHHLLWTKRPKLTEEERRVFLLASLLAPIQMMKGPHLSGKGQRHYAPASYHVIWEGLKWRKQDGQSVRLLHESVPELLQIYLRHKSIQTVITGNGGDSRSRMRVKAGLWVRKVKSLWNLGVLLAPVFTLKQSVPLGVDTADYPLQGFMESFNSGTEDVEKKRLNLCDELETMIRFYGVQDAWKLKPLVNGKTLMTEIGIKGGPILGEILDATIEWQLANPEGSSEECLDFARREFEKRSSEARRT